MGKHTSWGTDSDFYVSLKEPLDQLKAQSNYIELLIRENVNLQMRLDYAKKELDKLKAFNPMTLENLLDWREHE